MLYCILLYQKEGITLARHI